MESYLSARPFFDEPGELHGVVVDMVAFPQVSVPVCDCAV